MRQNWKIWLAVVFFSVGLSKLCADAAHCSWCPTFTCYGGDCGPGCVCLKVGDSTGGACVSFEE